MQHGSESYFRLQTGHIGTKMTVAPPTLTLWCSCRGQCWQCFSKLCYISFVFWISHTVKSEDQKWRGSRCNCGIYIKYATMKQLPQTVSVSMTFSDVMNHLTWRLRTYLNGGEYTEDEEWYNVLEAIIYLWFNDMAMSMLMCGVSFACWVVSYLWGFHISFFHFFCLAYQWG